MHAYQLEPAGHRPEIASSVITPSMLRWGDITAPSLWPKERYITRIYINLHSFAPLTSSGWETCSPAAPWPLTGVIAGWVGCLAPFSCPVWESKKESCNTNERVMTHAQVTSQTSKSDILAQHSDPGEECTHPQPWTLYPVPWTLNTETWRGKHTPNLTPRP